MNMSSAPIDFEGSAEPVEGSLLNEVAIFPFGGSMFDIVDIIESREGFDQSCVLASSAWGILRNGKPRDRS